MNPQEAFDYAWNRADLLLRDIAVARFGNSLRTVNDLDDLAKAVRKFQRETAQNPTIRQENLHMQTEYITPEITAEIARKVREGQTVRLDMSYGGYWEATCKDGLAEVVQRTDSRWFTFRGDSLRITQAENIYSMVVTKGADIVADLNFDETEIKSVEAEDGWLLKGAAS